MSNTLDTVTEAMCKVVRRVDFPLVSCAEVRLPFSGNPVSCKIPHLLIVVRDILLHTKECCLRLVFSIAHVAKFLEVRVYVNLGMVTAVPRHGVFFTASLQLDLSFITVANISLAQLDESFGKIIELLKIITGVCDSMWSEACRDQL